MKNVLRATVLQLSLVLAVWAQNIQIPSDADALVLLDEEEVTIDQSIGIQYRFYRRVLILNEKGNDYAQMIVPQSIFTKTKEIKAKILTAEGNLIRRLDRRDIETFHYSPGFILYDDAKYDYFDMRQSSFPYIFEVEYAQDIQSLLFWPDWLPQEEISVRRSVYRLILNDDIEFKTHNINIDVEPTQEEKGRKKILTWMMDDIEPIATESFMPPESKLQKALLFAAADFHLGDYGGSFTSWDTFAQWYRDMTAETYQLNQIATAHIRSIISASSGERDAVAKLYDFMHSYARYVAIETGILGWQPHPSQSVFDNRYGDCKDLTSFMISMLRIAEITAFPVMVKTRDRGLLMKDFPSDQFNHVMAVVPLENDTLWLECTAKLLPPNCIPSDYEGCDVLVITDSGGEIWRTPKSSAAENSWSSRIDGTLTHYGDLKFSALYEASGNQALFHRSALYAKDTDEEKTWIARFISKYQPNIRIDGYTLHNMRENLSKPARVQVQGLIPKFAQLSANRLFLNPNIMMRNSGDDIPGEKERTYPIFFNYSYADTDSLRIVLPPGYVLEAAPDTMHLKTPFASFFCSHTVQDNSLLYVRDVRIIESLVLPEQYDAYKEFINKVVKNDRSQFVFRKSS